MNINKLLTTAFLTLVILGNTAVAGEEAPRDEYSIGLVWGATDVVHTKYKSRVNLLMNDSDKNEGSNYEGKNHESMFPDFEH